MNLSNNRLKASCLEIKSIVHLQMNCCGLGVQQIIDLVKNQEGLRILEVKGNVKEPVKDLRDGLVLNCNQLEELNGKSILKYEKQYI